MSFSIVWFNGISLHIKWSFDYSMERILKLVGETGFKPVRVTIFCLTRIGKVTCFALDMYNVRKLCKI